MVKFVCYFKHANSERWLPYGGRGNPVYYLTKDAADHKKVQLAKYGYMGKPVSDVMVISVEHIKMTGTQQVITLMERV